MWYLLVLTSTSKEYKDVSQSVSIGILGCGRVAQNAYMPLVVNLMAKGSVRSVSGADPNPARLEEMAAKFRMEKVVSDPYDLINDPDIDVVLVLTSMAEHGDLAIAALKAGKHVLVEKPMATTREQAAELVEVARGARGYLVCAPHVMLSPDYQEMYRTVASGGVGRPLLARSRYGWDGPDWGQWFYAPGGGPLFDLGVYNVTSLTGLLGPVSRVSAMSTVTRPQRVVDGENIKVQTEDTFQIVLQHESGALSTVTTAFGIQRYKGAAVEVYGLEGTIQLLGDDWAPAGLEYWQNDQGAWQLLDSKSSYWPWTDGLSHLVECALAGHEPYTRPEHAFHVLDIMLCAMQAAETGQTQDVASRFVPPAPMSGISRKEAHRVHDRTHEDAQH
jgi:predicted dehydrogenase